MKAEFGIIGLGVMGKSLARNFADKGFTLSLFNRHVANKEENVAKNFIDEFPELKYCLGYDDLKPFVESLESPRKILIMVNAGEAVDQVIDALLHYLEEDDILIDGGNSFYKNTNERVELLQKSNINFVGMGVSGGEEGALKGPSLMPGGSKETYAKIENYLTAIAAKNNKGQSCCSYIGNQGAGHFVKMVHNGIEYAEMQLIAEVYSLLRQANGLDPQEISEVFEAWNKTELKNYLLESTSVLLKKKEGDTFLIDLVLDKASHKGTGSWTTIAAAELGVPFTLCSAALNARYISALKDSREELSKIYNLSKNVSEGIDLRTLKNAYQLSRIINHHQGFQLIAEASKVYNWDVNLKNVASVWTAGCIIASGLMTEIVEIFDKNSSILKDKNISETLINSHEDLKKVTASGINMNIPLPCLSESLNFINAITQKIGTGNIIQAQRDYFGAHTYKRIDDPDNKDHHTNWNN